MNLDREKLRQLSQRSSRCAVDASRGPFCLGYLHTHRLSGIPSVRPNTVSRSCPCRMRRSEFRVRNDRPRPRRKSASSNEVLPDPLLPQIKLRCGSSASSARWRHRRSSTVNWTRLTRRQGAMRLQAHWHHHVTGVRCARGVNEVNCCWSRSDRSRPSRSQWHPGHSNR